MKKILINLLVITLLAQTKLATSNLEIWAGTAICDAFDIKLDISDEKDKHLRAICEDILLAKGDRFRLNSITYKKLPAIENDYHIKRHHLPYVDSKFIKQVYMKLNSYTYSKEGNWGEEKVDQEKQIDCFVTYTNDKKIKIEPIDIKHLNYNYYKPIKVEYKNNCRKDDKAKVNFKVYLKGAGDKEDKKTSHMKHYKELFTLKPKDRAPGQRIYLDIQAIHASKHIAWRKDPKAKMNVQFLLDSRLVSRVSITFSVKDNKKFDKGNVCVFDIKIYDRDNQQIYGQGFARKIS